MKCHAQTTDFFEDVYKRQVITCCCNEDSELIELSNCNVIGFKHEHDAIRDYEVASRVALHMIARIIIDYLVEEHM